MQLSVYDVLHVDLSYYQGPLDLLLDLIRKKKMDIFSVRLADICEPYLEIVMNRLGEDFNGACEYMLIAATLISIKSGKLLPAEEAETDEENGTPDSEEDLRQKLIAYKRYKELAQTLNERDLLNREVFARPDPESDTEDAPNQLAPVYVNLNTFELIKSFLNVNQRAQRIRPYKIRKEGHTLEDYIFWLVGLLLPHVNNDEEPAEFFTLIQERVVSGSSKVLFFCALLEIIRRFYVPFSQPADDDCIYIYPNSTLADFSNQYSQDAT